MSSSGINVGLLRTVGRISSSSSSSASPTGSPGPFSEGDGVRPKTLLSSTSTASVSELGSGSLDITPLIRPGTFSSAHSESDSPVSRRATTRACLTTSAALGRLSWSKARQETSRPSISLAILPGTGKRARMKDMRSARKRA